MKYKVPGTKKALGKWWVEWDTHALFCIAFVTLLKLGDDSEPFCLFPTRPHIRVTPLIQGKMTQPVEGTVDLTTHPDRCTARSQHFVLL